MSETIRLKMLDKDVAFKLSDNQITESSIKHAFLLPPDAIVKLSYQENGQQIDCRMNETGTTFLLPDGWSSMQFHVESDQAPSRPSTPADQAQFLEYKRDRPESPYVLDEKLANELCNRLFFAPRGQTALRGPTETFTVKDGVIDGGCVSPISPRAAVTFAHKSHGILREYAEGQDDERNQHSLVEIRNCQNQNIRHIMKVIVVDAHHDFVLLFSLDGTTIFEDYPHAVRSPRNFEWFLGFGLSHETEEGQHMTHRTGRICSIKVDYRGRYLASSSIDGGDSGGPCYSDDRALIGIMVSSTTTSPRLAAEYERTIVEEEIADASASPADTWIADGSRIIEAYQKYLVQNGFFQPRGERELGGSKSKRPRLEPSPK